MTRMTQRTTVLVAVCAVGTLASCDLPNGGRFPQQGAASVSDAPRAAQVVPAEGLRIVVGTEKPEYVVGEPVYATIVLENTGEQPQRVVRALRPEGEVVSIFVIGPDGRDRLFRPLGLADHDQAAWLDLEAGGRVGVTVPIFFGADGWTFTDPGEYRIAAAYTWGGPDLPTRQLRSEPASVTIAPGGEFATRLTRGDAASVEAGKLLTWQAGDHLSEGRELLTGLVGQESASALASHAAFALGRSLSEPFADYGASETRPPDCQAAIRFLDQVRATELGTQSQALVEIARARCAAGSGDRARALDHLDRASAVVEGRIELQDLATRIGEYVSNLGRTQG